MFAKPRVVFVPTYAALIDMSYGNRRSTDAFHDWTWPRCTFSGSGVRIVAVLGSGARLSFGPGPLKSGMPCASVPYGCQLFRLTYVLWIVSG